MNLSNGEKLILVMLSEIHEKLEINGDIDPRFVRRAIHSENEWGLAWKYSGINFEGQEDPAIVKEVLDVLDMWSFIERAYGDMNTEELERIRVEADPFGTNVSFQGFDGNNESKHMNVALFLVDDLNRFTEFAGRDLNSHSPSIEVYERMLETFRPIRANVNRGGLSVDQLIEILRAKEWQ